MKKQLLCITFLIFLALLATPAGASYAMKIDLTGTSPAGYQMPVTIPYKSGMDANFANIRFSANSPSYISGTSIPYFIETATASTSALVWVPVPAGATTLYVEWGLSGETASESDISQVFPYSDHFEGASLNSSQWTVTYNSGSYSLAGSILTVVGNGSRDVFEEIRSKTSFSKPYEIISRAKFSGTTAGKGSWLGTRNSSTVQASYTFTDIFYENNYNQLRAASAVGAVTERTTNTGNNWGVYNLIVQDNNYSAFFNSSSMQNSPVTTNIPADAQYIAVGSGGSSAQQIEVDWIAWRIYDSTPVTGTVNTAVLSSIVAAFSANVTDGSTPLTVQFADSSISENIVSWYWDFGDGTNSTSQNPVHVYTTTDANPDLTFTVSLNVTNAEGFTDSLVKYNYIRLASSTCANFQVSETTTVIDDPIVFTDISTCTPVAWYWDFGDDTTSRAQNTTHAYKQNGNYTVSLTVTNATGSSFTRTKAGYILIKSAPDVDFSAVPVSGYAPLSIKFTDLSVTGGDSEWLWDFGDGTTSTLQNPIHNYTTQGSYTVSLTVYNFAGSDTKTKTSLVDVKYITAGFSANATAGASSLDVQFTDTSAGEPAAWSWDFGGGASPSNVQNPVIHFSTPGLYTISLTVSNVRGMDTKVKYGYIKISDSGITENMTISNVTDSWAYVSLGSSRDLTFSADQPVSLTHWSLNGGAAVNTTNQSIAYTFTESGYYVMEVQAENGNGQSNVIEFRTRVGRASASEHVESLNDSAYYDFENATMNMSSDGMMTALVAPFVNQIGKMFYLILFALPFLFLWFQQGKLTIPTTLALITGSLFIYHLPESYQNFVVLAIVLSFAANFYKLSRGPN